MPCLETAPPLHSIWLAAPSFVFCSVKRVDSRMLIFPQISQNMALTVTLAFELDLDSVKLNRNAVKVIAPTRTHSGPIALPGPLKWSIKLESDEMAYNN